MTIFDIRHEDLREKILNPDEVYAKAEAIIAGSDDPARVHTALDDLLLEVLRSVGYTKLCDLYEKQTRRYE